MRADLPRGGRAELSDASAEQQWAQWATKLMHQLGTEGDSLECRPIVDEGVAEPVGENSVGGDLVADYDTGSRKVSIWPNRRRLAGGRDVQHAHAIARGGQCQAPSRVGGEPDDCHLWCERDPI